MRYHACMGQQTSLLRTLIQLMFVAAVLMAALGVLRVPFAVRFWRRAEWVAWVWIAVMVLGAARIWFFS